MGTTFEIDDWVKEAIATADAAALGNMSEEDLGDVLSYKMTEFLQKGGSWDTPKMQFHLKTLSWLRGIYCGVLDTPRDFSAEVDGEDSFHKKLVNSIVWWEVINDHYKSIDTLWYLGWDSVRG